MPGLLRGSGNRASAWRCTGTPRPQGDTPSGGSRRCRGCCGPDRRRASKAIPACGSNWRSRSRPGVGICRLSRYGARPDRAATGSATSAAVEVCAHEECLISRTVKLPSRPVESPCLANHGTPKTAFPLGPRPDTRQTHYRWATSVSQAPTPSLPPPPLGLVPAGATQFPGGPSSR